MQFAILKRNICNRNWFTNITGSKWNFSRYIVLFKHTFSESYFCHSFAYL